MLAKVVAHAASRTEAVRRLAAALEGMRIHGLRTNRDQVVAALRHPEFLAGEVDTGLLDRHHDLLCAPRAGVQAVRIHAAAAALSGMPVGRDAAPASFSGPGGVVVEVRCRVDGTGAAAEVEIDGEPLPGLRVGTVTAETVDLEVDGRRRQIRVSWADPRSGGVVDVDSALGHTELVAIHRGPA
jgi:propionyl-CoA carboxylase alpha chain